MEYRSQSPEILRDFLAYHETIKGQSRKTVSEYFLDMRTFFRYMKIVKGRAPRTAELADVSIMDVDLSFIKTITLSDVYDYLAYLSRDREQHPNSDQTDYGINAASRARKISSIRSFYKYLTNKAHLLEENPVADLEFPRVKKALPRFLSLDESLALLESVKGKNAERDYCILTLFLNCGMRISELTGLNLNDVRDDYLVLHGKGNKDRIVFMNDSCKIAVEDYFTIRSGMIPTASDKNAFFLSSKHNRISSSAVHRLVKKHLLEAGLDSTQYSAHKLRHTAATLMLRNGVDIKTLQEVLGHEHLNTTEIYTHVDSSELRIAAEANPLAKAAKRRKK